MVDQSCRSAGRILEDDILAKRLIRILPDWHSEEVTIHLVFATNRGIVAAVRVLIDYPVGTSNFHKIKDIKK